LTGNHNADYIRRITPILTGFRFYCIEAIILAGENHWQHPGQNLLISFWLNQVNFAGKLTWLEAIEYFRLNCALMARK
jgi:hypothetical protein